jgi:hypothetical protein
MSHVQDCDGELTIHCSNPSCTATLEALKINPWTDIEKRMVMRARRWTGTTRNPLCPRCTEEQ